MKGHGNGDVALCAENLLRIFRGENPYERVKGIDARSLDKPALDAEAEILQDAEFCIENYEPRAQIDSLDVYGLDRERGDFRVVAAVTEI
nr:MAG TPA: lysozyme [Caudoviricetes sp.]